MLLKNQVTKAQLNLQNNQLIVENWNLKYSDVLQKPLSVRFWTGVKEGEGKIGFAWSEAQLLGGHTPIVYVRDSEGKNIGAVALTHIEVL